MITKHTPFKLPTNLCEHAAFVAEIVELMEAHLETDCTHSIDEGQFTMWVQDLLERGIPPHRCSHGNCRAPIWFFSDCYQTDDTKYGGGEEGYFCPQCMEPLDPRDYGFGPEDFQDE